MYRFRYILQPIYIASNPLVIRGTDINSFALVHSDKPYLVHCPPTYPTVHYTFWESVCNTYYRLKMCEYVMYAFGTIVDVLALYEGNALELYFSRCIILYRCVGSMHTDTYRRIYTTARTKCRYIGRDAVNPSCVRVLNGVGGGRDEAVAHKYTDVLALVFDQTRWRAHKHIHTSSTHPYA